MLTTSEIKAIRFYTGDVEGTDAFWGDPKAYVVLNSLFFPGIRTETDRAREGKRLNPALLSDPERLLGLLRDLLSACRKCALTEERKSFRVERFSDYEALKTAGATVSFTSTSTAGFLDAYADRKGIALMKFTLPPGTPCLPMAEILPHYAKAEEAEILLPPGLGLSIQEQTVPEKYLAITDADGKPPVIFAEAMPTSGGMHASAGRFSLTDGGNLAGMHVFSALMEGKAPDAEDIAAYTTWKAALVQAAQH